MSKKEALILTGEYIGRTIKVIKSRNKSEEGLCGEIINETKQLFELQTQKGIKKALKKNIHFSTKIDQKNVLIRGEDLIGKPEERVKRYR